jgi:hypothetical protein
MSGAETDTNTVRERTIQVDWEQEHTTVVIVNTDGTFSWESTTRDGPNLTQIIDPHGGPEIDRDALLDFIAEELA